MKLVTPTRYTNSDGGRTWIYKCGVEWRGSLVRRCTHGWIRDFSQKTYSRRYYKKY
jgi:hypothetical protein